MGKAVDAKIEDLKGLSMYALAVAADCSMPDSSESAGAAFLRNVRDDVLEQFEYDPDNEDVLHEIADGAPSVYTSTRWQEFVDLQAYHEDPTELGCDGSDMLQAAAVCLYIIAERLAGAIWTELQEARDEDGDEESA